MTQTGEYHYYTRAGPHQIKFTSPWATPYFATCWEKETRHRKRIPSTITLSPSAPSNLSTKQHTPHLSAGWHLSICTGEA